MPRKKISTKMPEIRRKCFACGKIKLVVYREWKIPETKWTANAQTKLPKREDIPGASVKNYCCYPLDNGEMECMVNA